MAVAALRAEGLVAVRPADHVAVLRLLAKRNTDLGRTRNRTACRLHALLADLVPGGLSSEITVAKATRFLAAVTPRTAVETARHAVALEHLDDLRRLDGQLRDSRRRITAAIAASGTTLVELFGIGPIIACTLIGYSGGIHRFADRHRYAAYNGTAPIEVSSGGRVVHRLSRRGNRQLNHALHMAAVSQIRHAHSDGRAYYDRNLTEGKTKKEALRALKRRISDAVYHQLLIDAATRGPGRTEGNDSKPA